MNPIAVLGIGTDVGKTIVSAIIVEALQADYWKPVQCGNLDSSDALVVQSLSKSPVRIFPEAYQFKIPVSPHNAASLDSIIIDPNRIVLPLTKKPLVIEGCGGLFVPLNESTLMIDLFVKWNCHVLLVSKHYLGSINHTLLSIEALKRRNISMAGLVFNGNENKSTEDIIISHSRLPVIGRLIPEANVDQSTITKYANLWKTQLKHILQITN